MAPRATGSTRRSLAWRRAFFPQLQPKATRRVNSLGASLSRRTARPSLCRRRAFPSGSVDWCIWWQPADDTSVQFERCLRVHDRVVGQRLDVALKTLNGHVRLNGRGTTRVKEDMDSLPGEAPR